MALLLAACNASVVASHASSGAISTSSPSASSLPTTTPPAATGRLVTPTAVVHLGTGVSSISVGPTGIWAVTEAGIVRIDPATNTVAASYPMLQTANGYGIAVTPTTLWVNDFDNDRIYRLDPATGRRLATIKAPPDPNFLVVANGALWVANHRSGSISEIDAATNTVVKTVTVGPTGYGGPLDIVPAGDSLWVGSGNSGTIVRVDPGAGKVTSTVMLPIPVGGNSIPFVVDPAHIWAFFDSDTADGIAVLDPTETKVESTIDVGGVPRGGVVNDGAVWVPVLAHTSGSVGEVLAIDPSTNAIVDRLSIADGIPDAILIAFGSAWIELGLQGSIERIPLAGLTVSR